MHTLKIPHETKKTCVIVILAALLLVAVGSCAGMTILRNDAAAAEREGKVAASGMQRTIPQSLRDSSLCTREPTPEMPKELLAVEEAYTPSSCHPSTPLRSAQDDTTRAEAPERTFKEINGQVFELAPASETVGAQRIGTFRVTHYAPCVECCGKSDGISASGRKVIPYYSVAVDPTVIPLGTVFFLDYGDGVLHKVRADDTGAAVKGFTVDLCVSDYDTAVQMGVRSAQAYLKEGEKDEPYH